MDRGPWFTTWSGRKFYLTDSRASEVDPRDIVHATARICRFGGHASEFYSVAQHLCLAYEGALTLGHKPDSDVARWALIHDAAEAYVGDMIRPLKYFLKDDYRGIESRIEASIEVRFLCQPSPKVRAQVKEIDARLLYNEALRLMPHDALGSWTFGNREPLDLDVVPWTRIERAEFELGRRLEAVFPGAY